MTAELDAAYTYWARYTPSAARTYAIRGWVGVAIWVGLAVLFWLALPTDTLGAKLAISAFMLVAAAIAAHAALRAKDRWGAEGGLAIAINDRGVTLPVVGEIPWEQITRVRSFDMGVATGNVFVSAFESWHGTKRNAYLTVYIRLSLEELGRLPRTVRRRSSGGLELGEWGFSTAYRQGLGDTVWAEASAALLDAAARRGIPVVD